MRGPVPENLREYLLVFLWTGFLYLSSFNRGFMYGIHFLWSVSVHIYRVFFRSITFHGRIHFNGRAWIYHFGRIAGISRAASFAGC